MGQQTLLIDDLHSRDVGLVGPKLVCGEAGRGACTVMETTCDPVPETVVKRAINSCVRSLRLTGRNAGPVRPGS